MTPAPEKSVYVEFERKPASEPADTAEIIRGILTVQARFASQQHQPLARGTHAKGTCVRAEFEVLDVWADRDPALAARLANGIFARPGVYPAVVRFANAASKSSPDRQHDLRALSFSVDVARLASGAKRLDYSLQSWPTFPINNVHAFATLMRVLSAAGPWGMAKAMWSLSLKDLWGLFKSMADGVWQQRKTPLWPYVKLRYWSTVPFRHGARDAIKYAATPNPANPTDPEHSGQNILQEELIRHVNEDERMSEFDFGLQFLDAGRMTYKGRLRSPDFWIENASIEWNEDEAPFHTVARLRLLPKSVLSPEQTAAQYIDVHENSTPDSYPLGGINRARAVNDRASRIARDGGVVDMPAAVPVRRSRLSRFLRGSFAGLVVLIGLGYATGLLYKWGEHGNVPALEHVDSFRYLNQGWGTDPDSAARELYYFTAQGASMLDVRYSWFINVEQPFRSSRLADPDHLRRLRFIVDPVPSRANPDQLPVGLAKRYDTQLQDYVVDITCALCHTGQLNVTRPLTPAPAQGPKTITTAVRIDGGQGMMAFTDSTVGSFISELIGGLSTTLVNPFKFNRFADGVLGRNASMANKFRLWQDVAGVVRRSVGMALTGGFRKSLYPTQEGYGRTDAIARISNVVFGDHIDPANYRTGLAPESYPYLWNIWKFDWEQYGAFVAQPMARNSAEAMGSGATFQLVDAYGRPVPPSERYRSSFAFNNVEKIESTLRTLTPPEWPEDLLGAIDLQKAEVGRKLFVTHCQGCHGPRVASRAVTADVAPLKVTPNNPPLPVWVIKRKSLTRIGTDPMSARDLMEFRLDLMRTGLDLSDVKRMLKADLDESVRRGTDLMGNLQKEMTEQTAAARALPANSPLRDQAQERIDELSTEISDAKSDSASVDQAIDDLGKLDLRSVSIGEGLSIIGAVIRQRYYSDHNFSAEARACFDGYGMLDLPEAGLGYKPRPLEGVWATPPFLHNGSVPTLYDLLSPVEDRPKHFYVGRREFDPVRVGYVTPVDPADNAKRAENGPKNAPEAKPEAGEFRFDTSLPGNSNSGHEFNDGYVKGVEEQHGLIGPKFTKDEKWALIEYLKIHRDDLDIVQYLKANNGKYPPVPWQNLQDECSALIPKVAASGK